MADVNNSQPGGKALPQQGGINPPPAGYDQPPPVYSPQQNYSSPQSYAPQQGHPPPPQYGYPAPVPRNTAVVIGGGTPVLIAQPLHFGESPVVMVCPKCQSSISTTREYSIGGLAWLICLGLFFFGFWLCSFIPFCVPSCKDVIHSCPSCQSEVGRCSRL